MRVTQRGWLLEFWFSAEYREDENSDMYFFGVSCEVFDYLEGVHEFTL